MPLPVLLGPAAGPAAAAAAKAAMAVGYDVLPTISSASLAAVLARLAWNRVPDWIKEDVTFRDPSDGDIKEMERLSSVLEKLQALVETASAKLEKPVPNLYAAILAYAQLSAQLKQTDPLARDEMYVCSGKPFAGTKEYFENLKEMLNFSNLAYYPDDEPYLRNELERVGFSLVHVKVATRPGSVGHYVTVSHEKSMVVIGVKGTSSLEDILTDCCGQSVPYNLGGDDVADRVEVRAQIKDEVLSSLLDTSVEVVSGHERISVLQGYDEDLDCQCHEGVLVSTKRLYEHVKPVVEDLVVRRGYSLTIVGHSLGASVASLLGVLLRSRIPEVDKLKVYAFAPPPVLDHDGAVASASYVTSIVNNSDIIPRWSLVNLQVFLEFLRVVSDRLRDKGLRPTGPRSTAMFLHHLSLGVKGHMLMTSTEVKDAMAAAHEMVELRHPHHLYVPGKVLLMYEHWQDGLASIGQEHHLKPVADQKHYCCTTDGTAKALRVVEIDGYRMLSDHVTASYCSSIESLCSTHNNNPAVK